MTAKLNALFKEISSYLTPILIGIIGWYIKADIQDMKQSIDQVVNIRIDQAEIKANYKTLEFRVSSLEHTREHTREDMKNKIGFISPAKHEEIFAINPQLDTTKID